MLMTMPQPPPPKQPTRTLFLLLMLSMNIPIRRVPIRTGAGTSTRAGTIRAIPAARGHIMRPLLLLPEDALHWRRRRARNRSRGRG